MTPTYLICIDENHKTALTQHAVESWEDEDGRYVIIDYTSAIKQVNRLRRTADLMIVPQTTGYNLSIGNVLLSNPYGAVLFQNRLGKPDQAYYLNYLTEDKSVFQNFLPLRTWTTTKGFDGQDLDTIIMRPTYGARSIGLLVLNPKKTSFESVARVIVSIDQSQNTVAGNLNSIISNFNKEVYDKLQEIPGSPVWCSDGDAIPKEGLKYFTESAFIQEYVPNIQREFRIIVGADNTPVYVLNRYRTQYDNFNGLPMAYARGCHAGMENSFTNMYSAGISVKIEEEFQALLNKANFALHSFDLFVTDNGKWGVLEFSNEFGTSSVPNELVSDEIKKYLKGILSNTKQ